MKIKADLEKAFVTELFNGTNNALSKLVESIVNQVLEAQLTEHLGAEKHERNDERAGYRNGHRERKLYTRVGVLNLRVPQTRDGSFSTDIFDRYQRTEKVLLLSLMEMVVNGVSTRKVSAITEELCGIKFSKSTVSALSENLMPQVQAFNNRKLEQSYPFIVCDAMFIKSREADFSVVSRALLVAIGIRADGFREILGLRIDVAENTFVWEDFFKSLKNRGLKGVRFVVSDSHGGMKNAISRHFIGASWQRCQVHLMRNLMASCSFKHRGAVIEAAKRVLYASDRIEAVRRLNEFIEKFEKIAPKAVTCLEEGWEDARAVMCLPEKYWLRLRTSNMIERVNEEVRRREKVIRIFPHDESALRLVGSILIEKNEKWATEKYFCMHDYDEWLSARLSPHKNTHFLAAAN